MRYLILLLSLSLACWGLSLPSDAMQQGFLFWRNQGIQLTGILAIALMGALMLMALRPHWLEQHLGGLDHLYKLHKWSGITAGSMVLLHWLLTKSPRWLVDWGLLQLGPRPAGAHVPDAWRGIAKEAGVDFVKTSTGFGTAGANVHDVALMRRVVGSEIGVKAAGGIRDLETALALIQVGATRIGTSSGIQIVESYKELKKGL